MVSGRAGFVLGWVFLVGCYQAEAPTSASAAGSDATSGAVGPQDVPAHAAGTRGRVDLVASFRIPQKEPGAISHTPAVVFTRDGKRMLTATSEGELVVFHTSTRRVLARRSLEDARPDAISIDADGRHVAWGMKTGGIAVMDVATGRILARADQIEARWLALAPDGAALALAAGARIELRSVPGLERIRQVSGHAAKVTNLVWSRDGRLLGSTAEDGRVVVRDVRGQRTTLDLKKAGPLYALAFRPDNGAVAFGGRQKKIFEYDLTAGNERVVAPNQPYWITCLAYSQDGKRLAVGDESCDVWLFDLDRPELVFHNKHHVECWLSQVAWSRDGETFLFGCRPNTHAARPSPYTPLAWTEAARSKEARDSRRVLLREVTKRLARVSDESKRAPLLALREQLTAEDVVQEPGAPAGQMYVGRGVFFDGNGAQMAGAIPLEGGGNVLSLPSVQDGLLAGPTARIADLPQDLQGKLAAHRKKIADKVNALGSTFCLNPWRVAGQR